MTSELIPDEAAVWEALRTVIDPEIGENIVDLGLIYTLECGPNQVYIEMTMTSPACPMSGSIVEEAKGAIRAACADAKEVTVALVFDPPWAPERMSAHIRGRFGW